MGARPFSQFHSPIDRQGPQQSARSLAGKFAGTSGIAGEDCGLLTVLAAWELSRSSASGNITNRKQRRRVPSNGPDAADEHARL